MRGGQPEAAARQPGDGVGHPALMAFPPCLDATLTSGPNCH